MFTKESLERLKEKIDLIELVSSHIDLKRSGATYKALCPFHQEKSPSFTIQKAGHHYHCFGCGAHGDAIQFLMQHLNFSFVEAIESLAEKFHVTLERRDRPEEGGVNKNRLKEACQRSADFFHEYLLFSEEGKEARSYLYRRGLTFEFIRRFNVGLAPTSSQIFLKAMHREKFSNEILQAAGLLTLENRPFFRERILFPISNALGSVVGFSGRVFREGATGGKYINTPETPLFKKSRTLFGLNFSRKRIVKEKRALIVEGQIDSLRLIESGLDLTVASLGTSFGEGHVEELKKLGIRQAYLLFDGDEAGQKGASKVGNLFQAEGIETRVVMMPPQIDPDTFLMQFGIEKLLQALEEATSYLTFQVNFLKKEFQQLTPAAKTEIVHSLQEQIKKWQDPIMVYESLKQLAHLMQIPEEMVGVKNTAPIRLYAKKGIESSLLQVDPHRILELDYLRWLFLFGEEKPHFVKTAQHYLTATHFWTPTCRDLFLEYIDAFQANQPRDLISLAAFFKDPHLMDEILNKKINPERAEFHYIETLQKILDRQWMQIREEVKMKIHHNKNTDEELLNLAKQFDELKEKRIIAQFIS